MSESKILTFGELCEAIIENQDIEVQSPLFSDKWIPSIFIDDTELGWIYLQFKRSKYRIKPAPIKTYQWLIKDPGHGFFITANWHTREQAERQFGFYLAEPYLPSERAL